MKNVIDFIKRIIIPIEVIRVAIPKFEDTSYLEFRFFGIMIFRYRVI